MLSCSIDIGQLFLCLFIVNLQCEIFIRCRLSVMGEIFIEDVIVYTLCGILLLTRVEVYGIILVGSVGCASSTEPDI